METRRARPHIATSIPYWVTSRPSSPPSFMDLPPEIRLLIYPLLLCKSQPISRLDAFRKELDFEGIQDKATFLNLYPSILVCCRVIYGEGMSFLYSNTFMICPFTTVYGFEKIRSKYYKAPLKLPDLFFERITNLEVMLCEPKTEEPSLRYRFENRCALARRSTFSFPGLKTITVNTNVRLHDVEEFLMKWTTQLAWIETIIIKQFVDKDTHAATIGRQKADSKTVIREECVNAYWEVLGKMDVLHNHSICIEYDGEDPKVMGRISILLKRQ